MIGLPHRVVWKVKYVNVGKKFNTYTHKKKKFNTMPVSLII